MTRRHYPPNVRKVFLIFFMARSGSTWLTDLCLKTGRLGYPAELFNLTRMRKIENLDIAHHARKMLRKQVRGGVFGTELSWGDIRELFDGGATLGEHFPNARTIFLIREDIVLQAVSTLRRVQTQIGNSLEPTAGDMSAEDRFQYDGAFIKKAVRTRFRNEQRFEEMFAAQGYTPMRMSYERNMRNPLGALNAIADLIEEPRFDSVAESDFTILRTDKSAEFAARFCAEEPRFVERIGNQRRALIDKLADY